MYKLIDVYFWDTVTFWCCTHIRTRRKWRSVCKL